MGLTKTGLWMVVCFIGLVYWDSIRTRGAYLSDCHWAKVQIIINKAICLECKTSCKLVQGWDNVLGFDIELVNEVLEKNKDEE